MKSTIRYLIFASVLVCSQASGDIYSDTLAAQVKRFGYTHPSNLENVFDPALATIGELLFENERLSFNSKISCKTCHLDEFSSTDGLPNAIGVGGDGKGRERLNSEGVVVPRNVLPLWGRGIDGFDVLFWDGKVEKTPDGVVSQFLSAAPSEDPLVVAAHLPLVEIREMVVDNNYVNDRFKLESVDAGYEMLDEIIRREQNTDVMNRLAAYFDVKNSDLDHSHVGEALAAHIRNKFQLRPTILNEFLSGDINLNEQQIQGGLLFYGKGRCVKCHKGPTFTDLKFHTIAFPQSGFGKNGFGVDYGRYNVTDKASDLFRFRTPPLIEVENTAPYGHSGSLYSLSAAIVAHFDPLSLIDPSEMEPLKRVSFFHTLQTANNTIRIPYLDALEVQQLEEFLKTLSFANEDD